MKTWNRQLWRMAAIVEASYRNPRQSNESYFLPDTAWSDARTQLAHLALSQSRGWQHAVARLRQASIANVEHLGYQLQRLIGSLQNVATQALPTMRTLYEELVAVSVEFDDVKRDGSSICATTEPIVLEDIPLGRFEIRLELDRLGQDSPYSVVALDPNPPAACSDTTHPHVSNSRLCPGEGRAPIAAALAEGRLFDFFVIVDRVLHTYSEGAAFTELDRWHGVPCHDCDCLLDPEEICSCQCCDAAICSDCLSCCSNCGDVYCSGCIDACRSCEERCCESCLAPCTNCGRNSCPSCLEHSLCNGCRDEAEQEDEEPIDVPIDSNAHAESPI